jgi:DNA-binding winged helix-turn-helix (wHTH) protein
MADKIRFGIYELDRKALELRKHGVVVRLQEQPFRVLAMLAGRPGEIVSREELREQIWANTFVDFDQSLNKAINRVREALNDNAGTPQYIETVPRRGYRFIAPVAAPPQTEAPGPIISVSSDPASALVQPTYYRTRARIVLIAALTTAVVLAAIGITAIAWLRQTKKVAFEEPRHLTHAGWFLAGNNASNYEMGVDQQASYHGQPSSYLKAKRTFMEGFGSMMQQFGTGQYAGRRVRLSAFVKAKDVDFAGLWMRVDRGPTTVSFDNMGDRPIKGTVTWQNYEVVLDVPRDATTISLGLYLNKSGTVWLNSLKFESVGPTNLNFEDQ